jgi:uncharacterized protein
VLEVSQTVPLKVAANCGLTLETRAAFRGRLPLVLRPLWFSLGWVCVALGFIGAVLPVMPSTVFFIAGAACFARSSPRFERWILELPGVGLLVRDYRSGSGMPRRVKIYVVVIIALAVSISAWRVPNVIAKIGSLTLGAIGIAYILARVPTKELVLKKRAKIST